MAMRLVLCCLFLWCGGRVAQELQLRAQLRCGEQCEALGSTYSGEHIYKINGSSEQLMVEWNEGVYLLVNCARGLPLDSPLAPRFSRPVLAPRVVLEKCEPPAAGLGPALARWGLARPPTHLIWRQLGADPLRADHFRGLDTLRSMDLQSEGRSTLSAGALRLLVELVELRARDVTVEADVLGDAPVLRSVYLTRCGPSALQPPPPALQKLTLEENVTLVLPPLPAGLQSLEVHGRALRNGSCDGGASGLEFREPVGPDVENVTLSGGAPAGLWVRAESLRRLRLVESPRLCQLPGAWLAGRARLEVLQVLAVGLQALPADLLRGAGGLRRLELSLTRLTALPEELLADSPALTHLLLPSNRLESLPLSLNVLTSLLELDVSRNRLVALAELPKSLRALRAADNPLGDTCAGTSPARTSLHLQALDLSRTAATALCHDWRLQLTILADVRLVGNNITLLQAEDLHWVRRPGVAVTVDLGDNPLCGVKYSEHDAEARADPAVAVSNVTILGVRACCDCEAYWWEKARRAGTAPPPGVRLPGVECPQPPERLECALGPARCVAGCRCALRVDGVSLVDCAGDADLGVWSGGPLELRLRDALDLSAARLPARVERLDVSGGRLRAVPEDVWERVGTLALSGNPLDCDCDSLAALDRHRLNVSDWELITCTEGGPAAAAAAACTAGSWLGVGLAAAAVALAALGAAGSALLLRHRHRVKRLLQSAAECDDEEERRAQYHVFVSYAHQDEETALRLAAALEGRGLRALLHGRDWRAGDYIPAQIARSVASARRTLALVSPHYLGARWALRELEAALALPPRRTLLLLLAPPSSLELAPLPHLAQHMATRTYLQLSDSALLSRLEAALRPPQPLAYLAPPPQ